MIVPENLAKDACLIVMGSEGRKEQMLKTDQDNALIIKNGVDVAQYEECMKKFTKTLIEFGFPECEGNIMVSNEYWRKSFDDFKDEILRWLEAPNKDDYMNLAIFFDSIAVAGDFDLLDELKDIIYENIKDKDVFLANFAKAALIFETPIGMFTKLISTNDQIDMKKGGIFPIVQGIRSLALEEGIKETNTNNRIRLLAKANVLDKEFANIVEEAFDTLLNLRLKERLRAIGHEEDANNFIYVQNLNQLEADLLKDSFKIVNKFKNFLSHHFKIGMVG